MATRHALVSASILDSDLADLRRECRIALKAGSDRIHFDVMDGHFVPNLSFGPDLARLVKRLSPLLVDVHLMVTNPATVAPWFLKAGADRVIFHWEACGGASAKEEALALLRRLRGQGVQAGVAVKPGTPAEEILPLLAEADVALIMTVDPGFGGAGFLGETLSKIAAVRRALDKQDLTCRLQVDGGINLETVEAAAGAGAEVLIAGHGVFGTPDPAGTIRTLRAKAQAAYSGRVG